MTGLPQGLTFRAGHVAAPNQVSVSKEDRVGALGIQYPAKRLTDGRPTEREPMGLARVTMFESRYVIGR